MALATSPYKGARDFYPEDKRFQDYIFWTLRKTVKSFGYQEYDAPILEPLDLYRAKTGEEIVNDQIYSFKDRGEREIAIRPEMTPSVSRMVAARRQELPYPVRWFSIPNLWRYERPQRGRLREHWQLNVDIFGESGIAAEHEMVLMSYKILKAFGAKDNMFEIRINHRGLMDQIFEYLGLNQEQSYMLSKLVDKKAKIARAVYEADIDAICTPSQKDQDLPHMIIQLLDSETMQELPEPIKNTKEYNDLVQLLLLLQANKVTNVKFDISVMRGFDYYTGIVFEVYDTDEENNRSMFGGGRYDGLVALFGVEPVPTVGFGMGDVTLANFLTTHQLLPKLSNDIHATVIIVGDVYPRAQELLDMFRENEMNVAVDASDRKIGAKIKSADKSGIRYVIFVGENELEDGQYPLKDLISGKEEKHSPERLISIIEDSRK